MKLPFTQLVESLPSTIPFVAPEAIERQLGIQFTTRIGANESAFGISPQAREALTKALDSVWHYSDPESRDLRQALAHYLFQCIQKVEEKLIRRNR